MCKMASFLYRRSEAAGVETRFHDLISHSETQAHFPECTEAAGWYEAHYTPDGEIECRTPDGRDTEAEAEIRRRWPTFWVMLEQVPENVTSLALIRGTIQAG